MFDSGGNTSVTGSASATGGVTQDVGGTATTPIASGGATDIAAGAGAGGASTFATGEATTGGSTWTGTCASLDQSALTGAPCCDGLVPLYFGHGITLCRLRSDHTILCCFITGLCTLALPQDCPT